MALGIVSGSEVSTPSSGGGKLDVGPLREAALAPGRMAAAIGQDVGGVFQDLTNQIMQVRNQKKVFDADHLMQTTAMQFADDVAKDPTLAKDPGTWTPAWQQRAQAVEEQIMNQSDLGPAVKRHLSQMVGYWQLDQLREVKNNALKREVADATDAGIMTYNDYLHNVDAEHPENSIAKAVAAAKALNESGAQGPKVTAIRVKQAPGIAAEGMANLIIANDPINAPDVIKDRFAPNNKAQDWHAPRFNNDAKYKAALRSADQAQKTAQGFNAAAARGKIDDSPEHTINHAWLKTQLDSKQIDQAQYDSILGAEKKFQKDSTAAEDKKEKDEFYAAQNEASEPPVTSSKKELDAWEARINNYSLGWKDLGLRNRLSDYVKRVRENVEKSGRATERPVESYALEKMKSTFAKTVSEMNLEMKPKETVDAEQIKQARMFGEMRDWFQSNPEATDEQAEQARQEITKGYVMDKVKGMLVSPGLSDDLKEAYEWARSNPDDPRSAKILKKLGL